MTKKGTNNNLDNHVLLRNRGFYFEDYETPKYEYKDQLKFSKIFQNNFCYDDYLKIFLILSI